MNSPYSSAPQTKKKKSGCLKWGAIGAAALVVIAIATGGDSEPETQADTEAKDALPIEEEAYEEAVQDDSVPLEHRNALRSAKNYVDFSHFSEAGLYGQLTSEYGEGYPAEAAQYAIDNVDADYNAEALEAAESYLDTGHFSQASLYDQLTSEYGEEFTAEQAQYAIDNVDADYHAEAVEAAESYQEFSPMSANELYNQLTSEYGEKFTPEQAQAAVAAIGL